MTGFIIRKFVKDYENVNNSKVRESYGKVGSTVGIILNAILCSSKIIVGTLFNSVAIMADGINNLSDAGSSVITLIGFKLSGKPADQDHPFGHARIEYIAGLIVSFIILLLGLELVKSSVQKMINPEPVQFSAVMIAVLVFSIVVKFWLSYFNGKLAKAISSSTMKATSMDSMNDVIATSAVLIAIIISKFTGLQIDGLMGLVVALFIIYSGIGILKETMNPLLGQIPASEFIAEIQNKIMSYDGVLNIHDLVVHNYGPTKYFATVHVEVDYNQDILKSHDMIDNIERHVADDMNVNLVIHLDPVVTDDEETNELKLLAVKTVKEINPDLTIHDFRMVKGETHTNLIFDVVVPCEFKMQSGELVNKINEIIKKHDSTYYSVVTIDRNYVSTHTNKLDLI